MTLHKTRVWLAVICDSRCVADCTTRAGVKVRQVNEVITWGQLWWTAAAKKDSVVHTGIYDASMNTGNAQQQGKQ